MEEVDLLPMNEIIFKDLKNMLDFGSKSSYGNEVTYFDPSRGWVFAYHEERNKRNASAGKGR